MGWIPALDLSSSSATVRPRWGAWPLWISVSLSVKSIQKCLFHPTVPGIKWDSIYKEFNTGRDSLSTDYWYYFFSLNLSIGVGVAVQLHSHIWLFATPWTAAPQVSLSFAISQSLFKLMSIESVIPSNHSIPLACLLAPGWLPQWTQRCVLTLLLTPQAPNGEAEEESNRRWQRTHGWDDRVESLKVNSFVPSISRTGEKTGWGNYSPIRLSSSLAFHESDQQPFDSHFKD